MTKRIKTERLYSVRMVQLTEPDAAALTRAHEDVERMIGLCDDARPNVQRMRRRALEVLQRLLARAS